MLERERERERERECVCVFLPNSSPTGLMRHKDNFSGSRVAFNSVFFLIDWLTHNG